jgi:hypothetical protein
MTKKKVASNGGTVIIFFIFLPLLIVSWMLLSFGLALFSGIG